MTAPVARPSAAAGVSAFLRRSVATPADALLTAVVGEGVEGRPLVAEAVAELVEGKILDDTRFAEHFVAYHANRGQGSLRIKADLKAVGLSEELIDAALARGPQWPALAREVRIRRFGLAAPTTWAEKGRQARFLQYRGFSSDDIRAAISGDFDPDEAS
jgi:regulatory protein